MHDLTTLEATVLDKIDLEGLLSFLDDLVSIPSLSGSEAENQAQQKVADLMAGWGMAVDTWEIDFAELSRHPAYSAEFDRPRGLGVAGQIGAGEGPTLILNGHTDVVPAGEIDRWHVDPWRATVNREEGRVYGRGALDMKAGLCCALFAAKALLDAGAPLWGRLLIQPVIGEEDGGCGTLATILRGHVGDAAIVLEPTALAIAPAQAGALNFRLTIPGKAAHGALREEGIDPLEKFFLLYQAITAYEKSHQARFPDRRFTGYKNPYPICMGTIRGGVWASTVAESVTVEGRLGVAVAEDVADARSAFARLIEQTAAADPWLRDHPPRLEWWGGQFAPAEIPLDHPLVQTLRQALPEAGGPIPIVAGVPYGSDMRLLVNEGGIPTVLFGPGDVRRAHQPDEYLPLADLELAVKTLALIAIRFCGVVEPAGTEGEQDAGMEPGAAGPASSNPTGLTLTEQPKAHEDRSTSLDSEPPVAAEIDPPDLD